MAKIWSGILTPTRAIWSVGEEVLEESIGRVRCVCGERDWIMTVCRRDSRFNQCRQRARECTFVQRYAGGCRPCKDQHGSCRVQRLAWNFLLGRGTCCSPPKCCTDEPQIRSILAWQPLEGPWGACISDFNPPVHTPYYGFYFSIPIPTPFFFYTGQNTMLLSMVVVYQKIHQTADRSCAQAPRDP